MKNKKTPTRSDTSPKARFQKKVKAKPVSKEGYLDGIFYESLTEMYSLSWLLELKKAGYVKEITRSESFLLSDSITNDFVIQMKRGSKPSAQTLVHGHSYTADYNAIFTKKAIGVFCWVLGSGIKWEKQWLVCHDHKKDEYYCHIEVKPDFTDWKGKTSKAVNDCKWVYQKYGKFINIFKPENRFEPTFTPSSYLLTGTGKPRKIKYSTRTLNEYLTQFK